MALVHVNEPLHAGWRTRRHIELCRAAVVLRIGPGSRLVTSKVISAPRLAEMVWDLVCGQLAITLERARIGTGRSSRWRSLTASPTCWPMAACLHRSAQRTEGNGDSEKLRVGVPSTRWWCWSREGANHQAAKPPAAGHTLAGGDYHLWWRARPSTVLTCSPPRMTNEAITCARR